MDRQTRFVEQGATMRKPLMTTKSAWALMAVFGLSGCGGQDHPSERSASAPQRLIGRLPQDRG